MHPLAIILILCLILSVTKAVLPCLLIGAVVLLLWGVFYRPHETFGLITLGLIGTLIEKQPLACLGFAAVLVVSWAIRCSRD